MKLHWPKSLIVAFVVTFGLSLVGMKHADSIARAIHDARLWYRASDFAAPESYRNAKQKFAANRSAFDDLLRRIAACDRQTPWQNPSPNPVWSDATKNRPDVCHDSARTDALATALRKAGIASADWYAFDGKVAVIDFYLDDERNADRIDSTAIVYNLGAWYGDRAATWEDNGACQQERRALTDAPRHWYWARRHFDPKVPEAKYCYDLTM